MCCSSFHLCDVLFLLFLSGPVLRLLVLAHGRLRGHGPLPADRSCPILPGTDDRPGLRGAARVEADAEPVRTLCDEVRPQVVGAGCEPRVGLLEREDGDLERCDALVGRDWANTSRLRKKLPAWIRNFLSEQKLPHGTETSHLMQNSKTIEQLPTPRTHPRTTWSDEVAALGVGCNVALPREQRLVRQVLRMLAGALQILPQHLQHAVRFLTTHTCLGAACQLCGIGLSEVVRVGQGQAPLRCGRGRCCCLSR